MLTAFAATKPVSLSKSKINLEVGISKTLKVKKSGSIKITQKTFSSSNKKVATVTQNGKITAQKAGKATINVTVKYKKGNKVKSSTLKCNVNVSEKTSDASNVTEEVTPTPVPETMPGADNQTTATQAPTATATASPTPNPASGKEEPTPTPTPTPTPMPLRDAGLYDTQGNMIKAWNQLVDESLMEVSEDTISECSTSLTGELVIDESVTSIGEYAFLGCSGLTSISIPESVTSIGYCAFLGCSGLASISVAIGNITYNSNDNCNAIIETATNKLLVGCKNTIIPESVTSIGGYAFKGCSGLTSISIPSNVTSIGRCAFWNCSGLTSISIPSSVTSIGDDAFNGCSDLASISVAEGNTKYNSNDSCNAIIETATNELLFGCKNTIIPSSVTSIGDAAFEGCSGLTSIDIPERVTSIGNNTFYSCSGLTSISIPSGVTRIGFRAFEGCSGLASISVAEGNTKYNSNDSCNAIIETATNKLLFGCKNTIIPSGVTSISQEAFGGCSGLTSIDIPAGVTSIGDAAFGGCSGLTSVSIPSSVTSIGAGAFFGL